MDHLPAATSLSRALLTLSRSGATGVLHIVATGVERGARHADVAIIVGTPRAIALSEPDENSLGDLLIAKGAVGRVPFASINVATDAAHRPVGEQLVALGLVSQAAVDEALTLQLRRRLRKLFSWSEADFRFVAGDANVGVPALNEPVVVADLVLGAMRQAVGEMEPAEIRKRLRQEQWELGDLGRHLLSDATLDAAELAMVDLLRAGFGDPDMLLSASGGSLRAMRTLYALSLIRGITRRGPDSFGLLLRKHREVQRSVTPRALLDLPRHASPREGRAALRRLARSLHPDRFHGTDGGSMRRMSGDVLRALVHAEERLRQEK